MLELSDFFHLPEVEPLVERVAAEQNGLIVAAGLDSRPAAPGTFLPSGRPAMFGILARRILAANRSRRSVVLAESKEAVRVPDTLRRQVTMLVPQPRVTYSDLLEQVAAVQPAVLVLDQLNAATVRLALELADKGTLVLSQCDCVFAGAQVAQHLVDLGGPPELLGSLKWVVASQRLPALCEDCRQQAELDPVWQATLSQRYPHLVATSPLVQTTGCATCSGTGRRGEVAVFDFFHAAAPPPALFEQPSELSYEEYMLRLALSGRLAPGDLVGYQREHLRRTYLLLMASERALAEVEAAQRGRVAQLEAANRVLQQRTESLVSLQEVAEGLISSISLDDVARRIGRRAAALCGADLSVLYVLRPDGVVEVLSAYGWDPANIHRRLGLEVFAADSGEAPQNDGRPTPYRGYPPGIPPRTPDVEGFELRAGLRVPLIAQNEVVGLMIIHSTRKTSFGPAETALLQAFANQAALAIQRTGLIEALQQKITQLEAAQAELVQKERMDRELELAREVQQSLLRRSFPNIPGFRFAAQNEAARRVGGDFYDIFQIDNQRFGIAIADVSDKGMPAALFMALSRSLLLAEARREISPRAALANVHRLLLELGDPGMFVTVFYGVVDTAEHTLTYCRAGHEEPLLLRDGAVLPVQGKGTFLGLLDIELIVLDEEQTGLRAGDRLVLYTDGLTDALNPAGEPFGLERLKETLGRCGADSPDDLCAFVFEQIADYGAGAEQYDDMAIVVVEMMR